MTGFHRNREYNSIMNEHSRTWGELLFEYELWAGVILTCALITTGVRHQTLQLMEVKETQENADDRSAVLDQNMRNIHVKRIQQNTIANQKEEEENEIHARHRVSTEGL